MTGELAHTHPPQHSSGCRGRALERWPGRRPSCPGCSCPLYPSLPPQVGQPKPPGRSRPGRARRGGSPCSGCWLLCASSAVQGPAATLLTKAAPMVGPGPLRVLRHQMEHTVTTLIHGGWPAILRECLSFFSFLNCSHECSENMSSQLGSWYYIMFST